jgi:hypothetical protein
MYKIKALNPKPLPPVLDKNPDFFTKVPKNTKKSRDGIQDSTLVNKKVQ